MMYRPLPDELMVGLSVVHGMGIIATRAIPAGTCLGPIRWQHYDTEFIVRTPLGGFLNHSDTPNCEAVLGDQHGDLYATDLWAAVDIEPFEELTITYTLYTPEGNQ